MKILPLINASLRPVDALSFGLTGVSATGSEKNSGPCVPQTLEYSAAPVQNPAALHHEEITVGREGKACPMGPSS